MALPANVSFGTVVGVFLRAVVDSADSDTVPDGIPIANLKIVFTATITPAVVRNLTSTPPVTFFIDPITVTTDANGVLVSPDGTPGVSLVATDDEDLDPHGWTWKVTMSGPTLSAVSFNFALPGDTEVDLSTVIPVPASPGDAVAVWQNAVAETAANVTLAQTAATTAQAAAASLDVSSFVKTVNGTAPDGSGNVVVSGSGTGTVTSVNGVTPDDSGVVTLDAATVGALPASYVPAIADVTGVSTVGEAVVTAADAPTARTAIGAGTSDLAVGTAATDAKAGDWLPDITDIQSMTALGKSVGQAVNPEDLRALAQAGTSDLVIGTAAGTAADAAATTVAIAAAAAPKYELPTDGVPATDLDSDVQASLAKADSALQTAPVSSVATRTGDIVLTKADVGLDNVSNTADVDKPVSTAAQAALDAAVQYIVYSGTAWPAARSSAVARIFVSTGYPAAPAPVGIAVADQWFRDKDAV